MNYAKSIRILRAAKGVSQQELAQVASLSKSLISKIESGSRDLSGKNKKKVATALNVPTNLLDILAVEPRMGSLSGVELKNLGLSLLRIKEGIERI